MKKFKGSGLLIMTIVSAAIIGLTAVSLAKVNHIAFNGLNSSQIALQAQQYAETKMNLLKNTDYDSLVSQKKTKIDLSNGFYDEVSVSAKSANSQNYKDVTINVFKESEALARCSLKRRFHKTAEKTGDTSRSFLINKNGSVSFTAPSTISKVSVLCTTNWRQNLGGTNSGTNTVNISSVGKLSMSVNVTKSGSKGHGWAYPATKSSAGNFNVNIPQGSKVTISTSSTGGWEVENTAILLIFS